MRIELQNNEYVGLGIPKLYDLVADKLNITFVDGQLYDCTRILVGKSIADAIFDYMENVDNMSKESAGMVWCIYGPKVSEDLGDNEIEVLEGFIGVKE